MSTSANADTSERSLDRLYYVEGRYGNLARWGLLLLGIAALWSWQSLRLASLRTPGIAVYSTVAYAALSLTFPILLRSLASGRISYLATASTPARRALLLLPHTLDYVYVSIIVSLTGGYRSDSYLLYGVLALKSSIYYPYFRGMTLLPFLSGALWVAASYANASSLHFLLDQGFLMRYAALFLLILGCMALGRVMEQRQRSIVDLDASLSQKSDALDRQARLVQRTANDLANRLLELRSLQESVKAINSSLALNELLQIIVDNATQVLQGARCTIALVDSDSARVITSAAAGIPRGTLWGTSFRIGQGVAGWVVENRQSVLMSSVDGDPRFQPVGNWPVASLISVPLISGPDVIGALTATSSQQAAFTEVEVNLLGAFSDQAAIAVKNARLYEQLVNEERETARLYQSVLEKSNELEAILGGIGDGVIVVDPELRLLMMNPVAARRFGVLRAPAEGVRLPEIVSNEALLSLARETIDGLEVPLIREITLSGEGDRSLIYQALATAVRGAHGSVRGAVIVMRDITTQREIDQVKSNFLSVVSHELRTPLHSIKGFVEIILMGKTGEINDLQRDFLTTVKESTTNLQRLIDDLLESSRMEAGKIKLEPEQMSVFEVTEGVVERLRPQAQEGMLTLRNDVPEGLAQIEADPMRIEQVLTNLIQNAIKFTSEEGTITVSASDKEEYIQISVSDTGIGIPEEEQARIFQRFYQVDSSATRSYTGAGLGLTICKFIVEYHHGKIWVESNEEKGSTFAFLLPKELPADEDLVIDFTTPVKRG